MFGRGALHNLAEQTNDFGDVDIRNSKEKKLRGLSFNYYIVFRKIRLYLYK